MNRKGDFGLWKNSERIEKNILCCKRSLGCWKWDFQMQNECGVIENGI